MKKTLLLMFVVLISFGLTGCFRTRTQLFWLPLIETTYVGNPERMDYKDKELTHFSISFIDTGDVDNDYENYQVNQFGDFSFDNIKVFEIILKIGFNNEEEQRYDVTFLGAANPNRENAYRMSASGSETINIVFDMQTPRNKFFGTIDYFDVSIKDSKNQIQIANIDVYDISLDDNDVKSITFSNIFENRNDVFCFS